MKRLFVAALLLSCPVVSTDLPAQAAAPKVRSVYVAVLRTCKHIKYAKGKTWDEAHEAVFNLLQEMNIRIAADPVRDRLVSEQEFSTLSLLNIAKDSGTDELLDVVIERPVTKWIKITLTCYSEDAVKEWEEYADYGGGLTGKDAVPITIGRLKKKLGDRVGKVCLPVEETKK